MALARTTPGSVKRQMAVSVYIVNDNMLLYKETVDFTIIYWTFMVRDRLIIEHIWPVLWPEVDVPSAAFK